MSGSASCLTSTPKCPPRTLQQHMELYSRITLSASSCRQLHRSTHKKTHRTGRATHTGLELGKIRFKQRCDSNPYSGKRGSWVNSPSRRPHARKILSNSFCRAFGEEDDLSFSGGRGWVTHWDCQNILPPCWSIQKYIQTYTTTDNYLLANLIFECCLQRNHRFVLPEWSHNSSDNSVASSLGLRNTDAHPRHPANESAANGQCSQC